MVLRTRKTSGPEVAAPGEEKGRDLIATIVKKARYFTLIEQPEGPNLDFKVPRSTLGNAARYVAQLRDTVAEAKDLLGDVENKFIEEARKEKKQGLKIQLGDRMRHFVIKNRPGKEVVTETKF